MNKYLVEFLGTMFLMFVILSIGEALPIGLALTIAIYLGGAISGGHFNPAVSVAMAVGNKISINELLPYVGAQVVGALVAFQLTKML
jgi:aquaporin Z